MKIDLYLILGCYGSKTDDFVNCNSISNKILDISSAISDYNMMMDYFDQIRLFDKPMFEYNAIRHFIHNLYDRFDLKTRPLWSEKQYELYQKFVLDHKKCGLFVKLELPSSLKEKKIEEDKPIFIFAKNKLKPIWRP